MEIWDAIRYETVLSHSRTKPLVLECERRSAGAGGEIPTLVSPLLSVTGRPMGATPSLVLPGQGEEQEAATESRLFVVKALGLPEVLEETLWKELFGNALAREFGIETPTPALIVLSEGFIASVQGLLPAGIKPHVGWAVGCEYLAPGLSPIGADFRFSPSLLPQAAQIYAFDLLTANPDRHVGNPNCAFRGGQLIAYDFESAFSYLRALFGPKPWLVSQLGIAQRHVFHAALVRGGADWSSFVNLLQTLDEARLNELVKDLPAPWLAWRERTFEYLLDARDSLNHLQIELEECLRLVA